MTHLRVERINDHGRHPNKFISFIKEDRRKTTKDEQIRALSILNRVAAIVYPIMKDNGLQVTTLEEHPFNDSYAGINYDAGDCIGLVLRTAHGGWIAENFVLSVMLHELSHCTNMHHAAPFWKTLGQYRGRMAQLREKGYTGEGFWRAGTQLGSGTSTSLATEAGDLPKTLCGGAFKGSPFFRRKRRRGGKREKAVKPGEKLGGDLEMRKRLDGGKSKATPRVVKSKRGRELRAAAAELRFSSQLTEQFAAKSDDETEDEDDEKEFKPDWKVEDEDADTQALLKNEMQQETSILRQSKLNFKPLPNGENGHKQDQSKIKREMEIIDLADTDDDKTDEVELPAETASSTSRTVDGETAFPGGTACSICTLISDPAEATCLGCGTIKVASSSTWECQSEQCKGTGYLNHVDSTICGLCGHNRHS